MDEGAVSEEELRSALAEQRESGRRVGEILVDRGVSDSETVARSLARQLDLPYAAPPLHPEPDAIALVRSELARTRLAVPLSVTGRSIRLAMADPLDLEAMDDIRFQTGRRVEPVVTTAEAIRRALDAQEGEGLDELVDQLPGPIPAAGEDDRKTLEAAARSAPVVRLVDHLLKRAAGEGASDVHLEPTGSGLRVRLRRDGLLRSLTDLPAESHAPVISRLKVMAGLDISVKRRPQDGSFTLRHADRDLSVRLSTLPAVTGEKAVLRLLDPSRVPRSIDGLGLSPEDLGRLRRLLRAGQGVILAAGPTGSGKSSTLFGALAEIDREVLNAVTLEDPVEYRLEGVNQVEVDGRAGLTFPTALRSLLRQDPDVIMIGEIRDRETAEIAMAAAVTGHLVLSSIHTIDAPGAVTRLVNMGVPRYLVAGGLAGVVAQRLVRRLCHHCGGRDPECPRCPDGYLGRTGVFQVLVLTDALREAVVTGASLSALRRLAREGGMRPLAEDARRKVAEGITSPHEVARVVHGDPGAALPCRGCGFDVPVGALGCPRCGRRRLLRCSCGSEVKRGWRFCPGCLRPVRGG